VTGGTFYRTYQNTGSEPTGEADPATVTSFLFDKYLVTVGRFRRFVAAWDGGAGWLPPAGSGKHTHLHGGQGLNATDGGYEPGWIATDNPSIAPTDANLECSGPPQTILAPGSVYFTWTPSPGSEENLPINCLNWYEAYAFCIWDGGFLPSDAEAEYAAAGGSAQREYPWGTANPGTGNQYAVYGCNYPSATAMCTGVMNLAAVGTTTLGAGLWGQEDLAGTLWEWDLDGYAPYVDPCTDCANVTTGLERVTRGGDFNTGSGELTPSYRHADDPADTGAYAYGVRCARSPL
jgi:formylglycine-generating enzyme required for sulfatase activity